MLFEASDSCPIFYTLREAAGGNRPRLALIHSLALDSSIWDRVVERLAGRAEILTYDCRGHGRSGRPVMPFTTELFARDLAELLDHAGWPAAVVAGCSMGGCIAQAFAGRYPSRVSALALIDTTAWYGEKAPQEWRERAATARAKSFAGMAEFQASRWFGDQFRSAHPELLREVNAVFEANDLDCYAATCAMLGEADMRPYLKSLRVPVAIVVGEEDYATPVAASRQLHEAIPGSTLTILAGGRHLTPVECPEQIASELAALLERSSQKSSL